MYKVTMNQLFFTFVGHCATFNSVGLSICFKSE